MGLGGRLAVTFAALVAGTAIVIGGISYVSAGRQVTGEIDGFLRQRSAEIAEGQRPPPRDGSNRRGDGRRQDSPAEDTGFVLSFDADSDVQLLAEDGAIEATTGLVIPVEARDERIADQQSSAWIRTVDVDGTDYRVITRHIQGGGAVQVARTLDEANSLLESVRSQLVLIALAMALVAAIVGWIVARRTTRPLRSLTNAVDAVAETQSFSVPVDVGGSDEVGRLAAGFDRMLRALDLSREQQHRLVQDAAHELRTPLTSIQANIDWLARAPDLDVETREQTLGAVRRELDELNGVINEIIELATDQHGLPELRPIDLSDTAAAAVEQFSGRSDRPVDVTTRPSPVAGDDDALQRAIGNLLTNADKYSPSDLPISIDVADGIVTVSDRGAGIAPADRSLVFDRFYRSDDARSTAGSGLGLAIVRGIVEAHDGTVFVGDAPGGGAAVGFALSPSVPSAPASAPPPTLGVTGGGFRQDRRRDIGDAADA
jgi:two-component system sensor histidine kinase MprB